MSGDQHDEHQVAPVDSWINNSTAAICVIGMVGVYCFVFAWGQLHGNPIISSDAFSTTLGMGLVWLFKKGDDKQKDRAVAAATAAATGSATGTGTGNGGH